MQTHQHVEERERIFKDWKVAVDRVFEQATHDTLTGLANRSLLHDRLMIALAESKRFQEILGVFFVDLDHFKKINDLLGHDVGDKVLTSIGARLLKVMRTEEIVARVGGDEFVALVRRIPSPHQVEVVGRRLLKELRQPLLINGQSLVVTASIGISLYPFDGENEEILLKNADTAMYRVKKRGGDGLVFFNNLYDLSQEPAHSKTLNKTVSKRNILIVDDDPDFQLIIQKRLKKEGYSCAGVASVEDALESVQLNTPDLVILDLGFHQASGLAFLQNFAREMTGEKKIPPVLVVSAFTDPEIIEFAKRLGASSFIPKPINTKQIVSAIQSFLH